MSDPMADLADPNTPAQRLYEIAQAHPELGQWIGAHPNAYPELRQWLAEAQQARATSAAQQALSEDARTVSAAATEVAAQAAQAGRAVSNAAATAAAAAISAATPLAGEVRTRATAASRGLGGFVRRHLRLTIIVAAALVVLLATGGGVGWYFLTKLGGSSSPTAAVEKLVSAVQNKDPLALYGSLAPSEIGEIQPSLQKLAADSSSGSGKASVGNSFSDLEKAVTITPAKMTFSTTQLAPGVARVTWTGGTLTLSGQRNQVADSLFSFVQPIVRSELTSFGLKGSAVNTALTQSRNALRQSVRLPQVFGPTSMQAVDPTLKLSVIAVQEGGGWYLSPLMTLADFSYQSSLGPDNRGGVPQLGDTIIAAGHYSTPEAAAAALVNASVAGDPASMAAAVSLPERRLLSVYGPWMQSRFGQSLTSSGRLTVTADTFTSTVTGDTAAVRIEHLGVTHTQYDDNVGQNLTDTYTVTGTCADWSTQYAQDNGQEEYNYDSGFDQWVPDWQVQSSSGGGCLSSVPLLGKLGAGDFTLSAVQENGSWQISPVATLGNALGIVVDHYVKAEKSGTVNQLFSGR